MLCIVIKHMPSDKIECCEKKKTSVNQTANEKITNF